MIGIIVTGHGNFATGISSSVQLIAGLPENYEMVDFNEGDSVDDLESKLEEAIANLKTCSGILIFSDLVGGSPFKSSVEIALKHNHIMVLSGTNVGMLLEAVMSRSYIDEMDALCNKCIEAGNSQVLKYEYKERVETESEEGI